MREREREERERERNKKMMKLYLMILPSTKTVNIVNQCGSKCKLLFEQKASRSTTHFH